jgi:hypothetical protein
MLLEGLGQQFSLEYIFKREFKNYSWVFWLQSSSSRIDTETSNILSILYRYHTSGGMQFGWRGPGEPHAQQKHIILDGISWNDDSTYNIYKVDTTGTVNPDVPSFSARGYCDGT